MNQAAFALAENRQLPLILDFTRNQQVYDSHDLPAALLKWRIFLGQEVQVILPSFCRGDMWRIRAIKEPAGNWLSPARNSGVVELVDATQDDVVWLEGTQLPPQGEMEYPGIAFRLVGRQTGKAVVQLFKSNHTGRGGTASYNLELTVAAP